MKKILFVQAQFIASAFDKKSFPKLLGVEGKPMPEIALVGKSNVGKSSLINHLLNNSSLAKTSSTPGKTQSINFFSIEEKLGLVDLPGYGYAKVSKDQRENWSDMIDSYLKYRKELYLILLLIDARRGLSEEDCAFIKWSEAHQKSLLLIFTKADKLRAHERLRNPLLIKAMQEPLTNISFLFYSVKEFQGRRNLIQKINELLKDYGTN